MKSLLKCLFAGIQNQFPFPFSVVPSETRWQMVARLELAGGVALVIGLDA